ncbi:hypothetical protein ACWDUD_27190 [Rhodococcus sp. NPDC003382]|nr:hypothetical protein [Rhodococcus zopfii]
MVALPKIHAERETLQKQWEKDRRERRATAAAEAAGNPRHVDHSPETAQ